MEVQVRSKKLVKPSSPTPRELQKWNLSFIDQKQPLGYLTMIFYYDANGSVEGVPARIRRLEESLSKTLTLFYPLAGRIDAEGEDPVVNCNDQGVEFVEAKVNWKLDQHLLDGGVSSSGMIVARAFNPIGVLRSSLPLVAIQANIFECGGLAISVQCNHAVADASSACMFINQWATASREGIAKVAVRPSFDLGSILPVQKGPKELFPVPSIAGISNVRSRRFLFNAEAISRLKSEVTGGNPPKKWPSKVELVMALICKVWMGIDQEKQGTLRPLVLLQAVGLRGRMQLQIQENAFGNVYMNWMSPPMELKEESRPEFMRRLIDRVRDALMNSVNELRKVEGAETLRSKLETDEEKMFEVVNKGGTNLAMFSSYSKLPIYTVNFGWGQPSFSSTGQSLVGLFHLMDTRNMDGINVRVTMEPPDMDRFESDPDILAYASRS